MPNKLQQGLKENWKQFSILVLINALVGGMIGMERTIIPEYALALFHISSNTAVLSFITVFGLSKAITNYYSGKLANTLGRKNLLIIGWGIAIPIPFILLYATNWNWVILANILLGISQGLTWSSTIVMKIDLVGERNRGLAMGINEFSGYFTLGIVAFFTSFLSQHYGVIPYPFYLGIVISILGLILSVIYVRDTRPFLNLELSTVSNNKATSHIFSNSTFKDKSLSAITQAGFVNNLNDGMIWGLLPILLFQYQFSIKSIGIISASYPIVWGLCQLFTGSMSDIFQKKKMLFWGMLIQGLIIVLIPYTAYFYLLLLQMILMGIGTALVYPTFFTAISQIVPPNERAETIGVFRLWRDLGYVFGAIISGLMADYFGIYCSFIFIGIITVVSAFIIRIRMKNY